MNPEFIIGTWLTDASISALVGDRVAAGQLPQNTTYPAIVYNTVDAFPEPNVAGPNDTQLAQARIQFNPITVNKSGLKQISTALRTLLDFKHQVTIGGKLVISMRLIDIGPLERDLDAGLWTQPIDYRLRWYE